MTAIDELIQTLSLEPIEVNLFRGLTPPDEPGRIFGGQVIAQALMAAYRTVEGRLCHSLQCYFIRPGDPSIPVLYQVERSRDGKSFTTRRVIAIQHGEQIFNMACSFHTPEDGLDHQSTMPSVPPPDGLADQSTFEKGARAQMLRWRAIEFRPVEPIRETGHQPLPSESYFWLRGRDAVRDDVAINQALLAYASDLFLLGSALRPHGQPWTSLQIASLDHIIWFHRPTNFAHWHLYAQDGPSNSGGRGFTRGAIYRDDGVLVASVAQEGLIRPLRQT